MEGRAKQERLGEVGGGRLLVVDKLIGLSDSRKTYQRKLLLVVDKLISLSDSH